MLSRHGFTVRAVVGDRAEVVDAVREHRPRICLIDLHFGDGDGIDLIGPVRAASPTTRVLMLTADRDARTADRALAAGAGGYQCKTAGVRALVATIRRVLDGEVVVDLPPVPRVPMTPAEAGARRLASHLTPRERECLVLLVDGLGSRAISERLGVSTATVRTHVQVVLTKLGVHSRLEAAAFTVRHGLLDPAHRPDPGRS